MQQEINRLTPEFFYPIIAKRLKIDVSIVRVVYEKYVARVKECMRKDKKVMVRGLGTFEMDPGKMLHMLYLFAMYLEKRPESFVDEIAEKHDLWYKEMSYVIKELGVLQLIKGNEYIKGSIEKLRVNYRRFDELFDNDGNCRKDFRIQDGDMQGMPSVLEEQGGVCDGES